MRNVNDEQFCFIDKFLKPRIGMDVNVKFISAQRGRGLFASRDFVEGEPIYLEDSLICVPLKETNKNCSICHHCLRHVGSVQLQFLKAVKWKTKHSKTKSDKDSLESTLKIEFPECLAEEFNCIKCPYCDALFCSEKCFSTAFASYHNILCLQNKMKSSKESSKKDVFFMSERRLKCLASFFHWAEESHILGARIVAMMVNNYMKSKDSLISQQPFQIFARTQSHLQNSKAVIDDNDGDGNAEEEEEEEEDENYDPMKDKKLFCRLNNYLKVVFGSDDVMNEDMCEVHAPAMFFYTPFLQQFNPVSSSSYSSSSSSSSDYVLSFADVISIIQCNSAWIGVWSPLERYIQNVENMVRAQISLSSSPLFGGDGDCVSGTAGHQKRGLEKLIREHSSSGLEQIWYPLELSAHLPREEIPKALGMGIFLVHSNVNHSCVPSAESTVFKMNSEHDHAVVQLVAKRAIRKGEEILISYLGDDELESLDVESRRSVLMEDYGFVCECERCTKEEKKDPEAETETEEKKKGK